MKIAVIGSGIAGLSAAWLLSKEHQVDLYEKDDRLGGHANSQRVETANGTVDVDTGFIVYNERTYPNLSALFDHIGVETEASNMSFSASLNGGTHEYSGSGLKGLFAKPSNAFNPRFLTMLRDIKRFYNEAPRDVLSEDDVDLTLKEYLSKHKYSDAFIEDHLVPMGAAIWCVPSEQMLAFPFRSFMRFSINHGLVQFRNRPMWRSIPGGSQLYVQKLVEEISGKVFLNQAVAELDRRPGSVTIRTRQGDEAKYDHIILACHSDQALRILNSGEGSASDEEHKLLSAIPYHRNLAILHKDPKLMPRRRAAWASWNYMQSEAPADSSFDKQLCVTYWMNKLQRLDCEEDLFVTLNPTSMPEDGTILRSTLYHHPIFTMEAMEAQRHLWSLQGTKRTWFCGAYFGYGFHEDGIQAGLAVAEQLGGVQRPWTVENPSGRIMLSEDNPAEAESILRMAIRAAAE